MAVMINGVNYAWGNIKLNLFGVPVVGITKISYKEVQVKDNNYGSGTKPVSRGYGQVTYEGSITIYADEWKRIIAASPNRKPLEIPWFDIPVIMSGPGVPYAKDTLRAVEFMENPLDANQGDTKLEVTIPLIIGDIDR